MTTRAASIAHALGYLDNESLTNVLVKREVVAAREISSGKALSGNGRTMVRLCCGRRGDNCFQVLFAPDHKPIEIDTVGDACKASEASEALRVDLAKGFPSSVAADGLTGAKVGLFYGGNDYRFPGNALSWGGAKFLDVRNESNPFRREVTDDRFGGEFRTIDFEGKVNGSQDLKFWDYVWWDMYGRVNGPGGNWDTSILKWDKDISIMFKPLETYQFESASTSGSVNVTLKDGAFNLPQVLSGILEDRFYDDVEKCAVVEISTHGGPINHRFQLRRDIDEWFLVGSTHHPFGNGNLRHLFFSSCGSMGAFKQMTETPNEPENCSLWTEWLPARFVRGARTVCGVDGEGTGLDRDGWRFFGYYNKGNSIASSFMNAVIDECVRNEPVTVAYGSTPDEAAQILADGRFSLARSQPSWAFASIWRAVSGEF